MSIIKLLPENVANQIAAGEVVQRPSSVVKELLENSVDCGSKTIKLIIKDAGKTLIQLIDDGLGMSVEDLDMCFLRHATSKIRNSKDLFDLKTMGFRGEALSSIAAVSHLTINSNKILDEDLGNEIKLEAGKITSKNEILCKKGTSISVRNLFFNIPARRNFLKSDNVELRHIIDEFHRVALINYNINFIFINNANEIFNLKKSIFKERIIRIFGKSTEQKLVPIREKTDIASIEGFVYKPEYTKKTRSTQFFFVNNRFVKNSHLHHAVKTAYDGLIFDNHYPSYFLNFKVPTDSIDVNIHPNKTEIKFDNDQSIYAILKSSIKHSLGQFNIAPTIDFESSVNLNTPYSYINKEASIPRVDYNKAFNPFDNSELTPIFSSKKTSFEGLEKSFKNIDSKIFEDNSSITFPVFQLNSNYIITKTSAGIVIIDQKRAHQRILYEKFLKELSFSNNSSQALIFPIKLDFNNEENRILESVKNPLIHLGFKFNKFDQEGIEISGIHPFFSENQIDSFFQELINSEISNFQKTSHTINDFLAKILSKSSSLKSGVQLENKIQVSLVNDLFACKDPNISPFNKLIFKVISTEEINKIFFK
ncbi:MAG: DNA mismatch repair endonuclease MutL [Flavobacteriaceae bacterium]|jgi:DNA mismatch repair protein MutL